MNIRIIDNGSAHRTDLMRILEDYGAIYMTDPSTLRYTDHMIYALTVLSGDHHYAVVNRPSIYQLEIDFIRKNTRPLLGLGLGAELVAHTYGSTLRPLEELPTGVKAVEIIRSDEIFGPMQQYMVHENHSWAISSLGDDMVGLGLSRHGYEAIRHRKLPVYGLQSHPATYDNLSDSTRIIERLIRSISS